jgi:hypothetical protein
MSAPDRIAAAVEARDEDAVREILAAEPGAADRPDGQGRSLLLLALFHGLQNAAEAILEHRRAPLDALEAAATGRADRLRELLEEDAAAVHAARTWEGFDAIGLAAFLGGAGAVAALLVALLGLVAAAHLDSRRCAPQPSATARSSSPSTPIRRRAQERSSSASMPRV